MERPLYHYEYLSALYEDVIELVHRRASAVLQAATSTAADRAREVVKTLHVPLGPFEVGRDIRIQLGELVERDRRIAYLPLTWRAEQNAAMFPSVDAELEIAALSNEPPSTQVSLVGSYTPPFGVAGAAADNVLGRRVADAAVHRFVQDVVDRIRAELGVASSTS